MISFLESVKISLSSCSLSIGQMVLIKYASNNLILRKLLCVYNALNSYYQNKKLTLELDPPKFLDAEILRSNGKITT